METKVSVSFDVLIIIVFQYDFKIIKQHKFTVFKAKVYLEFHVLVNILQHSGGFRIVVNSSINAPYYLFFFTIYIGLFTFRYIDIEDYFKGRVSHNVRLISVLATLDC